MSALPTFIVGVCEIPRLHVRIRAHTSDEAIAQAQEKWLDGATLSSHVSLDPDCWQILRVIGGES